MDYPLIILCLTNLILNFLSGIFPNEFTFASTLTACTGPGGIEHGIQVHSLVIKSNFDSHLFVGSSLVDMYAKAGQIQEARRVFDKLPERNVVSCTAIITGYAQLGLDEKALELFCQLQKEGMESNPVTYVSVLTALSGLAALDYGRQVHTQIIRSEVQSNVVLQNSLINMYSKCGSLTYSRRVFDSMPERTVISWNAMLVGYSKHGLGQQVLELFKLMQKEAVKPDRITLMAVLSGCSHGGLVHEGLDIFYWMVRGQYVEAEIEHYGCIVDLLGRAGLVDKALIFIKQMPFEPTAGIWDTLLGACHAHSNVPVGEYAALQLFNIDPQNARNYVILSNIFAASGRWEDVINVRRLMKEKTVMKEPGQSWIKLDRKLHAFYVSDQFHLKKGKNICGYKGIVGSGQGG